MRKSNIENTLKSAPESPFYQLHFRYPNNMNSLLKLRVCECPTGIPLLVEIRFLFATPGNLICTKTKLAPPTLGKHSGTAKCSLKVPC